MPLSPNPLCPASCDPDCPLRQRRTSGSRNGKVVHQQGCIRREGTSERPQRRLGRRLEEVAEALGGSYFRLQIPLTLALGVRGTVAGHRLGTLERGGGASNASLFTSHLPGGCHCL